MIHISYSQIDKLVHCPRRWEWEQTHPSTSTTSAMYLGSTFHLAASTYYKAKIAGVELTQEELLAIYTDLWEARTAAKGQDIQWGKETPDNQRQMGIEILLMYYPYMKATKPYMVEERVERVIKMEDGVEIRLDGIIDLITTEPKMIDCKTTAWMPYVTDIERSIQPIVYMTLIENIIPFEFHYLTKEKEPKMKPVIIKKTAYDVDMFQKRLLPYVIAMIQSGFFPPLGFANTGCKWCPLDGQCY
jgi:hypothetical protein